MNIRVRGTDSTCHSPRETMIRADDESRFRQIIQRVFPSRSFILPCILLACLTLPLLTAAADDIFAARPDKKKNYAEIYPTAAAFLSATKSGEIPDILQNSNDWTKMGSPVLNILKKEYGLDPNHLRGGNVEFAVLIQSLTKHELDENNAQYITTFQRTEDQLFGKADDKFNQPFPDSRAIFRKFATQYSAAMQAYITSKKVADADKSHQDQVAAKQAVDEKQIRESQLAAAAAEKRVQDQVAAQKTTQETQDTVAALNQRKALADAKAASLKTAADIKAGAAQQAMDKQKVAREQKLSETMASPAYKLWVAALQVQQGEEMISKGQHQLDHDDAVQRESGVTDLATRRAAGEQVVAGKNLVESSYDTYKKLGGKATNPGEVVAGPDPAAEYR